MSDIKVKIKVSGPGGTISYHMKVIEEALNAAGIVTEVEDAHPSEFETAKEIKDYVNNLGREIDPFPVILQAVHVPWGG
jgi:hypothetical protein